MRTLYIECGTTKRNTVNSGIQRVVRNVLRELQEVSEEYGFKSVPVEFTNGRFVVIHDEPLVPLQSFKPLLMNAFIRLDLYLQNSMFLLLYARIRSYLKIWLKEVLGIKNYNNAALKITDKIANVENNPSLVNEASPILLLLDSTWLPGMWEDVDRFSCAGGHVAAVLYDLIPFSHPDTVDELTRVAHTSWWLSAPSHLDSVICISQSVRKEFLTWQKTLKLEKQIPEERVGYFYLGANFKEQDSVVSLVSETVPFFLVVGSLEPRKNHKYVLRVFEMLWANGYNYRLAIVGAYGWKCENIIKEIVTHAEYNSRLFLIRDASDRDLAIMYAKTTCVILPSIAEGFGLPIVEAFQHGAPVLCSDIAVFREVGSNNATYFNVEDYKSLYGLIMQFKVDTGIHLKESNKLSWISWSKSAHMLLEYLNQSAKKEVV